MLIRDFMEERKRLESALAKSGFKCVPNLPNSLMTIQWESFQEYLSCLKRRYRHRAGNRMRKKEAAGIRTVITNSRDGLTPAADYAGLFRQVMERSEEYERESIGETYHRAMFDNLKGHSYWL